MGSRAVYADIYATVGHRSWHVEPPCTRLAYRFGAPAAGAEQLNECLRAAAPGNLTRSKNCQLLHDSRVLVPLVAFDKDGQNVDLAQQAQRAASRAALIGASIGLVTGRGPRGRERHATEESASQVGPPCSPAFGWTMQRLGRQAGALLPWQANQLAEGGNREPRCQEKWQG